MGAQRDIARILRKFTRRLRCVPAVPSYGYLRSSAAPQLRSSAAPQRLIESARTSPVLLC